MQNIIITVALYLTAVASTVAQAPAPPDAYKTNPINVVGKNSQWTSIVGVEAGTLIRVYADREVHFGKGSDDTAVAGVEGSAILKFSQPFEESA